MDEQQYFGRLQKGIDRRQGELSKSAGRLADIARRLARRSAMSKVALVVLGAFSATKGVADQLFGSANTGSLVIYALAGLLTATIAGLDAAFRWDRRSVDTGALAARSLSRMREVDTEYRSSEAAAGGSPPAREKAAIKVLALQDKSLEEVQAESTKLGINIAFELYPPSETTPPYPV